MIIRIEVSPRLPSDDPRSRALLAQICALGIDTPVEARISDLYFLKADLTPEQFDRLGRELLADPVTQVYRVPDSESPCQVIDVVPHPDVTDTVAENLVRSARTLGIEVQAARTGRRYELYGDLSEADLHTIARQLCCNEVIQTYRVEMTKSQIPNPKSQLWSLGFGIWDLGFGYWSLAGAARPATVEIIPLCDLDTAGLVELSRVRRLALDAAEMATIQGYFRREGREPTDAELETLAQTWSEHCSHKTFKGVIDYEERAAGQVVHRERIDGLLRSTIMAATEAAGKPWVHSAFEDNAGIIAFDDQFDLAFKVETHNHPSALEPFGGANTGVGGVIRDILGVSARPIANTDILCFGDQDLPYTELPEGVLHPRRVMSGVVHGIEDYGNKMGIPTVNGAILFHPGYLANPLVYCGCLGLLPQGAHRRDPRPGDVLVVIGGRTGRDGLRGATFSSAELTNETGQIATSAVQIGHPIEEKRMMEAILRARDAGLYTAITDCGAGGLSSAVGEMAAGHGARVHLECVPLKYQGLAPWEIWLSEAQERMVLAIPPANLPAVEKICLDLDVECSSIGEVTDSGRLEVVYGETAVADLDMGFLHKGCPRRELKAVYEHDTDFGTDYTESSVPSVGNPCRALLALLADPNIASKEFIVRRYDHEVQGATVVKPLVGVANDGPSDGAVLKPLVTTGPEAIALGCGINARYGLIDPYAMAVSAVDEAIRNVVALGADPDRVALLDNFCWGNPRLPDRLGGLVRAAKGCYDAAVAYGVPFISGKDSLNNEYTDRRTGESRAIPPTLLISAVGIIPDVSRAVTMDFKEPGNLVYVVGLTRNEALTPTLSQGERGLLQGERGLLQGREPLPSPLGRGAGGEGGEGWPPQAAPEGPTTMRALHRAIRTGLVRACHDCSEGGLAVALAEMCIAGRLGAEIDLGAVPRSEDVVASETILFSESNARFVVEVRPEDAAALEASLSGSPLGSIGTVRSEQRLMISGLRGETIIEVSVERLREIWQREM